MNHWMSWMCIYQMKKRKHPENNKKTNKLDNTKYQNVSFQLATGAARPLPPVSYATAHITFKVEWLKDPNLRSQLHMDTGNEDCGFQYCNFCHTTIRNATMSMLLRYNNSDRHTSSLAKLQFVFTSTFCDVQIWQIVENFI